MDKTPAKSILLSDGGFRRKVDVVPLNWFDRATYQRTLAETQRGVEIVSKYSRELITNYPFIYIAETTAKARQTNEGTRMGIRFAKNVKNDAEANIALGSYDIGCLITASLHHCITASLQHCNTATRIWSHGT